MPSDLHLVNLREVGADNWRECAALDVHESQRAFVSPVTRYLALCAYGGIWHPLAVEASGRTVGFVMCATDEADDSFWIGGLVINAAQQRRGFGRAAVESLIARAVSEGRASVALSYLPANLAARALYESLGFVETTERDDDEIVARLPLR